MTRREAFEILGLQPDASLEDARKAYRTLVVYYHPDKNTAANASVMFRIIQEAWEVIQTPVEGETPLGASEEMDPEAREKRFKRRVQFFCYLGWFTWVLVALTLNVLSGVGPSFAELLRAFVQSLSVGWLTSWGIFAVRNRWFKK